MMMRHSDAYSDWFQNGFDQFKDVEPNFQLV